MSRTRIKCKRKKTQEQEWEGLQQDGKAAGKHSSMQALHATHTTGSSVEEEKCPQETLLPLSAAVWEV